MLKAPMLLAAVLVVCVASKLVRGCGQQGAEFENWPFDGIAQIVGADEKERTALASLRDPEQAR
jgi:hypothetical protein